MYGIYTTGWPSLNVIPIVRTDSAVRGGLLLLFYINLYMKREPVFSDAKPYRNPDTR
jgi:hypothetical protein